MVDSTNNDLLVSYGMGAQGDNSETAGNEAHCFPKPPV